MSDNASGIIKFASGGNTERMRIDSSGNVGIGTSTITSDTGWIPKLVLSAATPALVVKGSSGQECNFGISNSLYIDSLGHSTGTNNNIIFRNTASNSNYSATERMRITSGGNLLVGTTSVPNSGNAIACFGGFYAFALNSSTTNNTWYQGTDGNEFNVYSADGVRRGYLTLAGTWTNTSDIAYKKDIVDIKYSLEDALKLRPVSYLTKDHDIPQIGFIAQEMEQVIPEVVSGEEGSKGISYGSLVALCVKAIQDLNAKVDAQDAEIQELKAELDATKAEVQALKGTL